MDVLSFIAAPAPRDGNAEVSAPGYFFDGFRFEAPDWLRSGPTIVVPIVRDRSILRATLRRTERTTYDGREIWSLAYLDLLVRA